VTDETRSNEQWHADMTAWEKRLASLESSLAQQQVMLTHTAKLLEQKQARIDEDRDALGRLLQRARERAPVNVSITVNGGA